MQFYFPDLTEKEETRLVRINGCSFRDCISWAAIPRSRELQIYDTVEPLLEFLSDPNGRKSLTSSDWQMLLAFIQDRWVPPPGARTSVKRARSKPLSEMATKLLRGAVRETFILSRKAHNKPRLTINVRTHLATKVRELITARFPDRKLEQVSILIDRMSGKHRVSSLPPEQLDKYATGLKRELRKIVRSVPPDLIR